jgi:hypothetical protein
MGRGPPLPPKLDLGPHRWRTPLPGGGREELQRTGAEATWCIAQRPRPLEASHPVLQWFVVESLEFLGKELVD